MKKILVAVALMGMAGSALAAPETYTANSGDVTDRFPVPTVFNYDTAEERSDRLFVKNDFEFTLSTNVIVRVQEDPDEGRFMMVAAGNTQGRNIFVGHSNGGSVSSCGDPLTPEEVKTAGTMAAQVTERSDIADASGCTEDDIE